MTIERSLLTASGGGPGGGVPRNYWHGDGINSHMVAWPMFNAGDTCTMDLEFITGIDISYLVATNGGGAWVRIQDDKAIDLKNWTVTINGIAYADQSFIPDNLFDNGLLNHVVMTLASPFSQGRYFAGYGAGGACGGVVANIEIDILGDITKWAIDSGSIVNEAPTEGPAGNMSMVNTVAEDWIFDEHNLAVQS